MSGGPPYPAMFGRSPMGGLFVDRADAGRQLAVALLRFASERPIVLALPRGGVPVGYEVAKALGAPLDVVLVRKLGAPHQPELGLGAIVDGDPPQTVLNEDIVASISPSASYLEAETQRALAEIARRRALYREGRAPLAIAGETIIVVDDGIATGGTMKAVLLALRRMQPRTLVLAVPVAPADTLAEVERLADESVCLASPEQFYAVGVYYQDFTQTTDEEVIRLMAERPASGSPPSSTPSRP